MTTLQFSCNSWIQDRGGPLVRSLIEKKNKSLHCTGERMCVSQHLNKGKLTQPTQAQSYIDVTGSHWQLFC